MLKAVIFLGTVCTAIAQSPREIVPDKITATRIAEAVLVARFGHDRVNAQLPLMIRSYHDTWFVGGVVRDSQGRVTPGGGFGVSITKQTGCLVIFENMK
jgi:hypothetical protein